MKNPITEMNVLQPLLDAGAGDLLGAGRMGLEKESLRVTPAGTIAQTQHPIALGAALTHPYITTDFSEALLELITPPEQKRTAALNFLADSQRIVYSHIGNECLWPASMPCHLSQPPNIPLANYGTSHAGQMKTIYRRGLALRYGPMMQAIAGVHCNYSLAVDLWPLLQIQSGSDLPLAAFVADQYMGAVRNTQRLAWLVAYLFGASPALDQSFLQDSTATWRNIGKRTRYLPDATSLRMGDIGYQNSLGEGRGFRPNYDSLDTYIRSLTWAIHTPCEAYEKIGLKRENEYLQLNTNVLQIENEHYSSVRPKPQLQGLEKPSFALRQRGILYLELRALDLDPFVPVGVQLEALYLVEMLLLFCILQPSPRITATEARAINYNQIRVAHQGRMPGLTLQCFGNTVLLADWAQALLAALRPLAEILDQHDVQTPYNSTLDVLQMRITQPNTTPSAHLLEELQDSGEDFIDYAQNLSQIHRVQLLQTPLIAVQQACFIELAADSWARQHALEANDQGSFTEFLEAYFNPA